MALSEEEEEEEEEAVMDITEVSIIHHVGIVLFALWLLARFNFFHPLAYFVSLIYLFLVLLLYHSNFLSKDSENEIFSSDLFGSISVKGFVLFLFWTTNLKFRFLLPFRLLVLSCVL